MELEISSNQKSISLHFFPIPWNVCFKLLENRKVTEDVWLFPWHCVHNPSTTSLDLTGINLEINAILRGKKGIKVYLPNVTSSDCFLNIKFYSYCRSSQLAFKIPQITTLMRESYFPSKNAFIGIMLLTLEIIMLLQCGKNDRLLNRPCWSHSEQFAVILWSVGSVEQTVRETERD